MRSFEILALSIGASMLLWGQHGYTPGDAEEGEHLFIENCAICHGPEGDAVPGIELARGKFRHATSDEDLAQLIAKGIPGTAMPPGNFHEHQLTALIAYLRSMPESVATSPLAGNPEQGKMIFEGKGECLKCHRVSGNGSYVGPELSDIGVTRRSAQLERSILEPDAEITPQNRFFRVVTQAGTGITGRLLNLDTFSVQILDSNERLRSFLKSDLKKFGFLDRSIMPSYRGKLKPDEIADVVAYLATLKGVNKP